ncbi:hypothetical protein ACHWQZ_G009224 [Mnemiopsis leidyi]
MADLKKLIVQENKKVLSKSNPEERFWKKFKFAAAIKEFGAVTHLSFSHEAPFYYTVTSGTKVNVYSVKTNAVQQSISRFKKTAFSGCIRRDGKLVVAGSEDNCVQVFEVGTRSILRQLTGHVRPCHVTKFDQDNTHILSAADDKTLRCWDLPTGEEILCMKGHDDYIRSAATVSMCPDIWFSGSYDHTVKMWDKRSGECTLTLDHGSPVESIVVLPSGGIAISCGSNKIKVWDVHRSGTQLTTLSNHQKTITCLALDFSNTRLLSSSLDHQVKMYDLSTYKVTHSIKYSAPVLAVGTTTDAVSGKATKRKKLSQYDLHLKRFQYREAFDHVMSSRHSPDIVVSVVLELFRRDAVKRVLSGRDEETLQPVLTFLVNHVTNPRHCSVLCDLAHILADLYSPVLGMSPAIDKLFEKLNKRLKFELKVQERYMKLQGAMQCFFTATGLS